ncbi:hypothetical protein E2P81_ATG05401 [Venturia nashicola]|nr:hypothetical protein E2P81_ATG05401 [Venturia nashicola]
MPPKRKLSEMSVPELSDEPPAMSTRSKRAKTGTAPKPQQQSIAKSIEGDKSIDTKAASGTKQSAMRSKEKVAIATAHSIPTPSLTPSPNPLKVEQPLPPKKVTRKRNTTKAVHPHNTISNSDATLAASPVSSPNSPLSQSRQHESKQETRKRTASKAFSSLSTNLDSDSALAPSFTSSPAEEQQQSLTKKRKTTRGRATVSPQSVGPDSDTVPAAEAVPVATVQQKTRATEQKTSRKRKAAKSASPDSAIPGSDKMLAPLLTAPSLPTAPTMQETRTKKQKTKQKTTQKRTAAKTVYPNSDEIPAPAIAKARSEQQEPRKSKKTTTTQKRATETVPTSSPIASAENEDITLLSPAERVAKFWMDKCRKVFREEDGYEVTVHALGDTGNQSKQQVFVWEKELYDEVLLTRPSSLIPESRYDPRDIWKLRKPSRMHMDGSWSWTEKDCDFLALGTVHPPATMEEYERTVKKSKSKFEERDVPILVIECRGAEADGYWEWKNPSPTGLSRSYTQSPESKIQKALIAQIYTFDDIKVNWVPAKGWMTQEQCFCATAIGDKIKFWKHASPYPHLQAWSGIWDKKVDEEMFDELVDEKLAEVKEDGFEFAMEWDGRTIFTLA